MSTITEQQRRAFWRAFSAATKALELSGRDAREDYRHTVLRECGGVEHLADLCRTHGYDAVMTRLWTDAGEYEAAGRYVTGNASRMRSMCIDAAEQIIDLYGTPGDGASYVAGVLRQAGLPQSSDWMLDVPEGLARRVFHVLDTHRRRLLRRLGYNGSLTYRYGLSYTLTDGTPTLSTHSRHSRRLTLAKHLRVPCNDLADRLQTPSTDTI